MCDYVITGGQVFYNGSLIKADVAIKGENIVAIGKDLKADKIIDAKGKWVLPGAIDAHTHISLPFYDCISSDDYYTASIAGAAGGVTTYIDFSEQIGEEGPIAGLKRRMEIAEKDSCTDYSFHACIAKFNDEVAAEIKRLPEMGIRSFKIFTAYNAIGRMQNDENLYRIMQVCKENDVLLTVHAENGLIIDYLTRKATEENRVDITALRTTRPVYTEVEAISRVCHLAKATGCKTHIVHISTGEGAEVLRKAKLEGAPVSGETCPQYLYLNDSVFDGVNGHYFGCCPPIRPAGQSDNIWDCLRTGAVAMVATDHCPFNKADKDTWCGTINHLPMGLPGIENMAELVLNGVHIGKLSLTTAIKAISENPAKIFGLYPQKGAIIPGADADLMIYDPEIEKEISQKNLHMNNDYSIYEGLKIKGSNTMTILRGKIIYDLKNGISCKRGEGQFVKRLGPSSEFF